FGASANYAEERFTQAVFRAETIYDVGIPFYDVSKVSVIDTPALPGVTRKNMWKGMVAFDRPTWIRRLNRRATFFITSQFFWHYLVTNPGCRGEDVAALPPAARAGTAPVSSADSTCRRASALRARAPCSATRSATGKRSRPSRHSPSI